MTAYAQYFYMAQVTYKAAINLVKCCILLLYLRLFHIVNWFRFSCWGLLAIVTMYCTASILVTIFQCRPIMRAFDKTIPGVCIDTAKFWFANAGFSIATDIIILLLPMPLVWKLEVPTAQKLALVGVFTVGIFAVITSCLRITTLDIFATDPDSTWKIENVMWTIAEPNVAFVCSCLPILRPFVVRLIPGLRGKSHGGGVPNTPGYGSSNSTSRSRGTQKSQTRSDGGRSNWVELNGVKSQQGEHLATVRRPNSHTGSEEDMLAGAHNSMEASPPGIQKTVEYRIQYSREE